MNNIKFKIASELAIDDYIHTLTKINNGYIVTWEDNGFRHYYKDEDVDYFFKNNFWIRVDENSNVIRKTWKEFREQGFLWWINMILHTFGWAIVLEMEDGEVIDCYPARVKYRGFSEKNNTEGYIKVSNFLKENAEVLAQEANE